MGGGRIVIRPPEGDAGDPVLAGNTVLYGATGGELYCAGRAGERFAVRNSGAVAVVEGDRRPRLRVHDRRNGRRPRRDRPELRRRDERRRGLRLRPAGRAPAAAERRPGRRSSGVSRRFRAPPPGRAPRALHGLAAGGGAAGRLGRRRRASSGVSRPRADVAAIEDEHEGTGGRAAEEPEEATAG